MVLRRKKRYCAEETSRAGVLEYQGADVSDKSDGRAAMQSANRQQKKTVRIARAENHAVWRTGVLEVGQVRPVGQVGQVSWYAECQSTTIKPAGLPAQKTPQSDKKIRRQAEKRKTTSRLPGGQPGDRRKTPATPFQNHAVSNRRMYRAARSTSNQGGGEGVYDCTRLSRRPPI